MANAPSGPCRDGKGLHFWNYDDKHTEAMCLDCGAEWSTTCVSRFTDLRIRQTFSLYRLDDIGSALKDCWESGKTPEAVAVGWLDWDKLESLAHGLGSNPAFLRFPILKEEFTAIVISERLDDHS